MQHEQGLNVQGWAAMLLFVNLKAGAPLREDGWPSERNKAVAVRDLDQCGLDRKERDLMSSSLRTT
jgi:hypothetical protein